MHYTKHVILIAATLFITGCATTNESVPSKKASSMVASTEMIYIRPYLQEVNMAGRLSMQYAKEKVNGSVNGKFIWLQKHNNVVLTILTPTDQLVAIIEMNPNGAKITQGKQKPKSSSDADELIKKTLGIPLPVSGLKQWLQGFAKDQTNKDYIGFSEKPVVSTIEGWNITYSSWHADGRPRKINLKRPDVNVDLLIDTLQKP